MECSEDQLVLFLWNMNGAFSTSHSTNSAFPAMSLNSAPGAGDRINVAVMFKLAILYHDRSEVLVLRPNTTPRFRAFIKFFSHCSRTLGEEVS